MHIIAFLYGKQFHAKWENTNVSKWMYQPLPLFSPALLTAARSSLPQYSLQHALLSLMVSVGNFKCLTCKRSSDRRISCLQNVSIARVKARQSVVKPLHHHDYARWQHCNNSIRYKKLLQHANLCTLSIFPGYSDVTCVYAVVTSCGIFRPDSAMLAGATTNFSFTEQTEIFHLSCLGMLHGPFSSQCIIADWLPPLNKVAEFSGIRSFFTVF
jgi:hypothetical protein